MSLVVGIDVSKAKLDLLWLRDVDSLKAKSKVLPNTVKGHEDVVKWLLKTLKQASSEILVVMEATGIYHDNIALKLYKEGFKVAVINPARIKNYGKGLGNTHKTDKQDSLIIARYGAKENPQLWEPEKAEIRELKALLARLNALEKDFIRENNRLEKSSFSAPSESVIESIHLMLDQLKSEKKRLEKKINDHIDQSPTLKKDRQLLESIPGIGPVLSRNMLAVIHSRSFTKASEVAAYLGVIPTIVESGVFRGRSRLSKKGSSQIRAKLYMAAVVASQHNQLIMAQKKRLLLKGKTKMQALGAAMRKLVHLCFGVIKNQTEYSPQVA